jgi:hypothetical protein
MPRIRRDVQKPIYAYSGGLDPDGIRMVTPRYYLDFMICAGSHPPISSDAKILRHQQSLDRPLKIYSIPS